MRTHRKGFTLTEVLVVMAVISILVSMLLPALREVMERTRSAKCTSNLKNIMFACIMYVQDNHGYAPYNDLYLLTPGSTNRWTNKIAPYLERAKGLGIEAVWRCPEDKGGGMRFNYSRCSYGMNVYVARDIVDGVGYAYRYLNILQPQNNIIVGDNTAPRRNIGLGWTNVGVRHHGGAIFGFADGHVAWWKYPGWTSPTPGYRAYWYPDQVPPESAP